jgi:TonB family protein
VDAIKEPDFGPYMRELQGKIKRNWDPPKSDNSKRVVLIFTIAKDGRLLNVRIGKSSGIPSADRAAVSAVEYSAPFRPLPKEFRGSDIDIHFTFDYNVFGGNIR